MLTTCPTGEWWKTIFELAMQNVSALQARPGMSVKASFTLHVRSAKDTQDSSPSAALSKRALCKAGSLAVMLALPSQ